VALLELFWSLRHFREKRKRENLSQSQLLKQELAQIALAVLATVILMGLLVALAQIILK
jgi:hypothetical protein